MKKSTVARNRGLPNGGRIWAEAALNRGATFFFTLGRAAQPEPATGTP